MPGTGAAVRATFVRPARAMAPAGARGATDLTGGANRAAAAAGRLLPPMLPTAGPLPPLLPPRPLPPTAGPLLPPLPLPPGGRCGRCNCCERRRERCTTPHSPALCRPSSRV
jgi:hypothetical protein